MTQKKKKILTLFFSKTRITNNSTFRTKNAVKSCNLKNSNIPRPHKFLQQSKKNPQIQNTNLNFQLNLKNFPPEKPRKCFKYEFKNQWERQKLEMCPRTLRVINTYNTYRYSRTLLYVYIFSSYTLLKLPNECYKIYPFG